MKLTDFDQQQKLEKANEKLTHYKTAAGADATAADASGNFARGHKRFKGINAATKKQFDNDAKLSQLKEFAPGSGGGDAHGRHTRDNLPEQGMAEAKNLKKHVKIVKGPDAGKSGWIREIKHGLFKGAPKTYYIDLDGGGQANNLPATALRLVKDQDMVENNHWHAADELEMNESGLRKFSHKKNRFKSLHKLQNPLGEEGTGGSEGSLNEFAPGGEDGNSPYAYGMAILGYAEDYKQIHRKSSSTDDDVADIIEIGNTFLNKGMAAGIAALFSVDTFVSDSIVDDLAEQGFNVMADLIDKRPRSAQWHQQMAAGQQALADYEANRKKSSEETDGSKAVDTLARVLKSSLKDYQAADGDKNKLKQLGLLIGLSDNHRSAIHHALQQIQQNDFDGAIKSLVATPPGASGPGYDALDYGYSKQKAGVSVQQLIQFIRKHFELSEQGVAEGEDSKEIGPGWKTEHGIVDRVEGNSVIVKTSQGMMGVNIRDIKTAEAPEQGMAEGSDRVDSIVTDALKIMKGPEVSDAVLAIKRVLGDRAYNERRGFYSFYVDKIHDMYGQQSINEGDVSTGNLQTMYNLARMAKNYCSDPEGKEALTELLRILKWYMDQGSEQGVAEDDDAVAAFLSRGGEIQQLKPQRGPKRSGVSFASKHIGSASGRGNTKGKVSGLGANTGKSGKPVVTAEQGVAEDALDGMKRLAGIASAPAQTIPGQRQYRHMPTAVQPR